MRTFNIADYVVFNAEHGEIPTGHYQAYGTEGHGWHGRAGIADCGHYYTNVETDGGVSCGTGYATRHDGLTVCHVCADTEQRLEVAAEARKDHGTATGYLSADARTITTWTGGHLMQVTEHSTARNGWGGAEISYVRARSDDGRRWYGKNGGPGTVITMRTAKRDAEDIRAYRKRRAEEIQATR